jgi:hypothetical protein
MIMKKLILFCFAAAFSAGLFAAPLNKKLLDSAEKIREIFHQNFPEIKNPTITNVGEFYIVSFTDLEKNSTCRIYYDDDGKMIQTIRSYTAENFNPFLRQKIESKYKGKKIFMVTDVTDENEHFYKVLIQDSKSLWLVHADDNGALYVQKKYKRAANS